MGVGVVAFTPCQAVTDRLSADSELPLLPAACSFHIHIIWNVGCCCGERQTRQPQDDVDGVGITQGVHTWTHTWNLPHERGIKGAVCCCSYAPGWGCNYSVFKTLVAPKGHASPSLPHHSRAETPFSYGIFALLPSPPCDPSQRRRK